MASWEVLAVDDLGPGCCPGTRQYRLATVAFTDDGMMRSASIEVSCSPAAFERWMGQVGARPVTPGES